MLARFFALAATATLALASPAYADSSANAMAADAHGPKTIANVGGPLAGTKPVLVRVHADWCPACKETAATVDAVNKQYAGRVTFVQFDVTDGKTAAASAATAKKLHLTKFYEKTKSATSTVAVIDPKTGNIIAQLYDDTNIADYTKAIDKTLALKK